MLAIRLPENAVPLQIRAADVQAEARGVPRVDKPVHIEGAQEDQGTEPLGGAPTSVVNGEAAASWPL